MTLSHLTFVLKEMKAENLTCQKSINEMNSEKKSLRSKKREEKQEKDKLYQKLKQLQDDKEDFETELSTLQTAIASLQTKMSQNSNEVRTINSKFQSRDETIVKLESDINNLDSKIEQVSHSNESKMKNFHTKLNELKQQVIEFELQRSSADQTFLKDSESKSGSISHLVDERRKVKTTEQATMQDLFSENFNQIQQFADSINKNVTELDENVEKSDAYMQSWIVKNQTYNQDVERDAIVQLTNVTDIDQGVSVSVG